MRSIRTAALVLSTIVAAACSDSRTPTAPMASGTSGANISISESGCLEPGLILFRTPQTPANQVTVDEEVKRLIGGAVGFGPGLFVGENRQSALSMWENLKKDKLDSRPMQSHVDNEAKFTLTQLGIGGIQDPDGAGLFNAVTGSIRVLDLIFRCTGTTPLTLPEPPANFNAEWEIVHTKVESIIQQFTTTGGDVKVAFDGDALPDGTLLVIVGEQPADVQVNTPFPKLTNTVDVALAGGRPTKKLSVLVCPSPTIDHTVNHRAVLAHQFAAVPQDAPPGQGVEYFDPPAHAVGLTCPEDVASNASGKGFVGQLASYAKKAWSFIGPKPLYAGHAAIGGSSDFGRGFSPIVAVDPFLETEVVITGVTPNPATFGDAVNLTAQLRIANVPANPEVYRGKLVSPDFVTGVVNKTNPGNTNLQMSARVDDGTPVIATTDDVSNASWSFSCVNAGGHIAAVNFAGAIVVANAPVYGSSAASTQFVVNPRDLTVTAANQERLYGDANPDLTGTLAGVQAQCDAPSKITAEYATDATQASDVGEYPITADVTFDEAEGDVRPANYNVITVPGVLTINPAPLTISGAELEREYGLANPPLTGTVDGVKNNDAIVVTYSTDATMASNVGDYPIVPAATGDELSNYIVTPNNGTLTIKPAPLDIAANSFTRAFGEQNPPFTGTADGIRNNDDVVVLAAPEVDVGPETPAGDYTLLPFLAAAYPNYFVRNTASGMLTITGGAPGFGAPTIDGVFGAREWDNARVFSLTAAVPGGTTPMTLYVMNDATHVYFAVRFQRSSLNAELTNLVNFEFDHNNNGSGPEDGDDYLTLLAGGLFADAHRTGGGVSVTDDKTDGAGAFGIADGFTLYEISHPLNSRENPGDFALDLGQTIGLRMLLQIDNVNSFFGGPSSSYQPITIAGTP